MDRSERRRGPGDRWGRSGGDSTGASCDDVRVRRFCWNVLGVYPALRTFARVEGVEPTNNHTERALRRAVIWRKVSFGNHSPDAPGRAAVSSSAL